MKPLDWRLYPVHPGNFSLLLLLFPAVLRNIVMYRVCKERNHWTGGCILYTLATSPCFFSLSLTSYVIMYCTGFVRNETTPGNFSLLLLLVPDFLRNNVIYRVCKE
jgi:hypothetical protein